MAIRFETDQRRISTQEYQWGFIVLPTCGVLAPFPPIDYDPQGRGNESVTRVKSVLHQDRRPWIANIYKTKSRSVDDRKGRDLVIECTPEFCELIESDTLYVQVKSSEHHMFKFKTHGMEILRRREAQGREFFGGSVEQMWRHDRLIVLNGQETEGLILANCIDQIAGIAYEYTGIGYQQFLEEVSSLGDTAAVRAYYNHASLLND